MIAPDFLEQAGLELRDRARFYDDPQAVRSMQKAVDVFRALTGHDLSEAQGWHFMACLKMVRSEQGTYRADNFVDGCAYLALAGEAAARVSKGAEQ